MRTSPFEAIEDAFNRHAHGPDPAVFWGGYTTELPPGPIPLPQLLTMLNKRATRRVVKDAAWTSLVRMARLQPNRWGIIAAGLAIRGLRRAVSRAEYHAPNIDIRDDLESAAIAGFLASIGTIDTAKPHICARLCQDAYVNARAWALELKQFQETMRSGVFESHPPPAEYRHVDLILADAVKEDIITRLQARLIMGTRLERHTVALTAGRESIEVREARKERCLGELRLYEWLTGRQRPHPQNGGDSNR
ncbi:hypothetical protein GCM10029992_37380 [Glycomyces albus]